MSYGAALRAHGQVVSIQRSLRHWWSDGHFLQSAFEFFLLDDWQVSPKFKVVSEATGQPIGFGMSLVRQLALPIEFGAGRTR
jgi:hypothetical protein